MTRRAVFLDRDGVLNRAIVRNGTPYPPSSLQELETLPGVEEACGALSRAGFLLIMVTNQPDVARGSQQQDVVEAINHALSERLCLNAVKVCYHDGADDCNCRKPEPGMLLEAAQEWDIDLAGSYMIGDRWKDIEAGRRAGCRTILVQSEYAERRPEAFDAEVKSLTAAAEWILNKTGAAGGEQK